MSHVLKIVVPAFAFTLGFVGTLQAAGDQMPQHSQGTSQQQNQMATVKGTVDKIDGDVFTIKNDKGDTIRLHLDEKAFQGERPKEGDKIQAKIPQGEETYDVVSVKKEGGSSAASTQQGEKSMQAQSSSQSSSSQGEKFTRTIKGEISKVDGNVYYVRDNSGKEIRLRLDQSAEQSGELKKGDTVEALVTQKKEFHVISAELLQ
ncbi:hypothetical protein [Candidatus Nitrospira neomarina]|uniref:DUF5666 domain-containing protein n=1 Tax=Candidatus Nitrospira neomarina TaxID=3020899 RepID=A0AA96GNT7_9BACT|nr:hypothetical protein [Candidatus Nitrospira neomarina]WNM62598.1 hypothetical protein PQG83_02300 [Candidatus Nitrospira neomarina]